MKKDFDELEYVMEYISKNWRYIKKEELLDLIDDSYNLGYTEGEIVGYRKHADNTSSDDNNTQDSYDEGFEEGIHQGREEGRQEGHDTGYVAGRQEGHDTGYEEGYNIGYKTRIEEEETS